MRQGAYRQSESKAAAYQIGSPCLTCTNLTSLENITWKNALTYFAAESETSIESFTTLDPEQHHPHRRQDGLQPAGNEVPTLFFSIPLMLRKDKQWPVANVIKLFTAVIYEFS